MATAVTLATGGLGTNPGTVAVDATGNYVVVPVGTRRLVVEVVNGAGAPITWTIDDPTSATPEGAAAINPDAVITVTNAQSRVAVFSGARLKRFMDPVTRRINWTYSSGTTVTVKAYTAP
jgi:DNA-binding beta-propeller fold protein YncE